jgi:hypothetical protein
MQLPYKRGYALIEDPNICPHCHVTINAKFLSHFLSSDTDDKECFITNWECTNSNCLKVFVALYKLGESDFEFFRYLNGLPKGPDWPKPILDLKSGDVDEQSEPIQSKFIKTYLQSLVAENSGLDEIAGMGYRKSIEYLVKDWAIQSKPEDIEIIKSKWLGQNITDYFTGDLKDILERATWLGNDQSHYNKLFDDYNLEDLKELIGLIMVELDRQFKMNHYIQNIQKRK